MAPTPWHSEGQSRQATWHSCYVVYHRVMDSSHTEGMPHCNIACKTCLRCKPVDAQVVCNHQDLSCRCGQTIILKAMSMEECRHFQLTTVSWEADKPLYTCIWVCQVGLQCRCHHGLWHNQQYEGGLGFIAACNGPSHSLHSLSLHQSWVDKARAKPFKRICIPKRGEKLITGMLAAICRNAGMPVPSGGEPFILDVQHAFQRLHEKTRQAELLLEQVSSRQPPDI